MYRRLTGGSAVPALPAEDLAAVADGTLRADRREAVATALAASEAEAKLAHVLRDLRAESEALASDIARTQRAPTHQRHARTRRRASGRRFATALRVGTALAACLVAAVGLFALRHPQPTPSAMPAMHTVARADRIFTTNDRIFRDADVDAAHANGAGKSDELFRGDFTGG